MSDRVLIRLFALFVSFYSNNNRHTLYLYATFPAAKVLLRASATFVFSWLYVYDARDCFF